MEANNTKQQVEDEESSSLSSSIEAPPDDVAENPSVQDEIAEYEEKADVRNMKQEKEPADTTSPKDFPSPSGDDDEDQSSRKTATPVDDKATTQPPIPLASISEVFSFGNARTKLFLVLGFICAAVAGAVGPFMIFYFANAFSELSGDPTSPEFLKSVKDLAFTFLVLGAIAFFSLSMYSMFLQTAAGEMTMEFKTKWYQALLRQDMAYFDIQDVSGTASIIGSNALKYHRGVGNKLGMAVQFTVMLVGGVIYAFYMSWQTSLIVLITLPFMAVSGFFLLKMTTSQTQRANASYAKAGSIVYTTATSIRTILSLNAVKEMIEKFEKGTQQAYEEAVSQVAWLGFANGSMMCSFLLSSIAVPLYGGYLLYSQVRNNGCDPSGAVPDAETCSPSGTEVFGAMFGIFYAAAALPQISTTTTAFTEARAACYLALLVMNRKVANSMDATNNNRMEQAPTTIINQKDEKEGLSLSSSSPLRRKVAPDGSSNLTSSLPNYLIDSSSPSGEKLETVKGEIEFKDVSFSYPTRKEACVLDHFSLKIEAGKTVALVGPSGSGKSTVAQLLERFYDPTNNGGAITLDGHDLRDINVKWLRQQIGLVSQEPTLFAASIRENIRFGAGASTNVDNITQVDVEQAAKLANAHDFIMSFPDGYDTQVGDKGTKLSGGQKQRIALARVLIKNPKILLLDEATSALDSESERVVQTAIDSLLEAKSRTTIVIAHRLSTIRNADLIAVLKEGKLVETGTHEELIAKRGQYFSLVEAQKAPTATNSSTTTGTTDKEEKKDESSSSEPNSAAQSRSSSFAAMESGDSTDASVPVLRFHNVRFYYPSRPNARVFNTLNLSVNSGETLAIVGPSGHGKSTVIQLIERFYDPVKGSIELDGVDIKELNIQYLRSQIGLVSQMPTLFDTTISENIRFGIENVSQDQIEQAAKDANAHDFIMSFPDGYDTQVGEAGTQVSGGQKQRICIARALLRKPRILLLDEATSALDSESERVVQEALDKIMGRDSQTTIVIAHRLSTIRNANRIAVIMDGMVKEIGTYDELMSKKNGQFQRLQALQSLDSAMPVQEEAKTTRKVKLSAKQKLQNLKEKKRLEKEKKKKEEEDLEHIDKMKEKRNAARARKMAKDDGKFFLIGSVGAVLAGAIFPAWGFLFAYTIELLYQPVFPCEETPETPDCEGYWNSVAHEMKVLSNKIAIGSIGTILASMIGYTLLFYGFGTATERMNKRVRDEAFTSLVRQEVSFFDLRPIGKLTSQLQDDAALIHSFSGEPIRSLVLNVSSVVVGLLVGFIYMWPFALVFIGILPFLGFGAEMEMKMYVTGEDEGDDNMLEEEHSPGGIVIESLLNMRTVASLTMEDVKLNEYKDALQAEDPTPMRSNFLKGSGFGTGQLFQFWGIALMFWFGAWLLHKHPDKYEFRDFIIAMFALFFSLYGLTVALEGATDRKRAKLAADRVFDLTDRKSLIDPLSEEGRQETELSGKKSHISREEKQMKKHASKKKSKKKLYDEENVDGGDDSNHNDQEEKPKSKPASKSKTKLHDVNENVEDGDDSSKRDDQKEEETISEQLLPEAEPPSFIDDLSRDLMISKQFDENDKPIAETDVVDGVGTQNAHAKEKKVDHGHRKHKSPKQKSKKKLHSGDEEVMASDEKIDADVQKSPKTKSKKKKHHHVVDVDGEGAELQSSKTMLLISAGKEREAGEHNLHQEETNVQDSSPKQHKSKKHHHHSTDQKKTEADARPKSPKTESKKLQKDDIDSVVVPDKEALGDDRDKQELSVFTPVMLQDHHHKSQTKKDSHHSVHEDEKGNQVIEGGHDKHSKKHHHHHHHHSKSTKMKPMEQEETGISNNVVDEIVEA